MCDMLICKSEQFLTVIVGFVGCLMQQRSGFYCWLVFVHVNHAYLFLRQEKNY